VKNIHEPIDTWAGISAEEVSIKKGEILLRPKDDTENLHEVKTGLLKVYTINKNGDQTINAIYGPRDLFPMSWIIDQRHQEVYIEAITDVEVVLITRDSFMEMLNTDIDFAQMIAKRILEQFYLYASRVSNLGFKYAKERLAYSLLVLSGRFGERTEDGVYKLPYITQQDIAAMINVSRENVSREVSRLDRSGVIRYSRPFIEILKPEYLQKEIGDDTVVFYNHS
jgi:CRP/FNR family cyclic AMP-dependent transcriptional regulator